MEDASEGLHGTLISDDVERGMNGVGWGNGGSGGSSLK